MTPAYEDILARVPLDGNQPIVNDGLAERDYGAAENELRPNYIQRLRARGLDLETHTPEGGETPHSMHNR